MVKIFFVTFFIAELIIAVSVIFRIYQFDRCVNNLNRSILANQNKIRLGFIDFRLFMEEFTNGIVKITEFIRQRRQEYFYNVLKTSLVYGCIFFMKGKYKKSVLAYQLIKEIYEGFQESEV